MHTKHMEGRMAPPKDKVVRTTLVLPDSLLHQLKIAAAEERTDVSRLLNRIAEDWLKARKGGRR
jgi:hypothetical protein